MAASRNARLKNLLQSVLREKDPLPISPANAPQFLEAIYTHPEPVGCVDRLIGSPNGLSSLQSALRFDLKIAFLNTQATKLLVFCQSKEIRTLSNGDFLQRILLAIVEPPIFLRAYVDAFKKGDLSAQAQEVLPWLICELLSLPDDYGAPSFDDLASELAGKFSESPSLTVRDLGKTIRNILAAGQVPADKETSNDLPQPGGRHSNDFADFRKIAILPTADELSCTKKPFLRPSSALDDPKTKDQRVPMFLDSQYRLLREDMIHELREELQLATGKVQGRKRRAVVIKGLQLDRVYLGDPGKRRSWALIFRCTDEIAELAKKKKSVERAKYLKDNPRFLKHQSLTCLLVNGEPLAFPSLNRDETLLTKQKPEIVLELAGDAPVTELLLRLKTVDPSTVELIQIDVALFAYEPILNAIKRMRLLPLSEELLLWERDQEAGRFTDQISALTFAIKLLEKNPQQNLGNIINLPNAIRLDNAQGMSLLMGLSQKVSIIQGPPGTGKSFIGALLAKFMHDFTSDRILVVCFTNHALDQFLEDLLNIGIPRECMVRLGGKSTQATEDLLLQKQDTKAVFRFNKADFAIMDQLRSEMETRAGSLESSFRAHLASRITNQELLGYLEFEEPIFYEAFRVPASEDGMQQAGKKGKAVTETELINRWTSGNDAGFFRNLPHIKSASVVWQMTHSDRLKLRDRWSESIMKDGIRELEENGATYNRLVSQLTRKRRQRDIALLRTKRIIGCTTTAAAKYGLDIEAAAPDVVLVEEAGEILESHVVTSLGSSAKRLILIGDHKQLRPKVNNYQLTVEKGEGYDLNRSMFERLVLKGYPHSTLVAQHRMRPEISALIRSLTYPDLQDAERTKNRLPIRGLQDVIIFINHSYPEDAVNQIADRLDQGSKTSKQNTYEARMILKIVRYLGQQGYGTDDLVILTPYLGQLTKIRSELQSENDPVLNDLDSYDLIRAGLLSPGAAKVNKKRIRLATIDNYQGEESDIVVVSLTRSNPQHDIGFMFSPERLNVLLSRARNGLILIGNSDTFSNAKKGKELWQNLFKMLRENKHVYDGLPVRCEQHPNRVAILRNEEQFLSECPDGGCSEPCGTKLNCGVHDCPSKCHQLSDHSKIRCEVIVRQACSNGHDLSRECSEPNWPPCKKCERAARAAEVQKRKELEERTRREAEEAEHQQKMKDIEDQIKAAQQRFRDTQLKVERENALFQKQKELEEANKRSLKSWNPLSFILPANDAQIPGDPNTILRTDYQSLHTPQISAASMEQQSTENHENHTRQSDVATPAPELPKTTRAERSSPGGSSRLKAIPTCGQGIRATSNAAQDWEYEKSVQGMTNDHMDAIMNMVGLEKVKEQMLKIINKINLAQRQGLTLAASKDRFNIALLGNPGTGKTTVARHYARLLASLSILPGSAFEETSGSAIGHEGVDGAKKLIEKVMNAGGGAIFIDEAYQLKSEGNFGGPQVLDFFLTEMENRVGKIVFILAGYNKEMEKFFEHNPGIPSRVPYTLQFEDYTDEELLGMFEQKLHIKYRGQMKVEGGARGLFGRIAIRRLGRGRGTASFGNVRSLENMLQIISERQAKRIAQERRVGRPDDFLLFREDLIGPNPSEVLVTSESWKKLQELIGLKSVKDSVAALFKMVEINYQRELNEKEPLQVSLNRVFLGSPGTGKTTVAAYFGKILRDLGLLSNGEVVLKNPADFIGQHLGESETKTKGILNATVGKILIIDEAYMLYGGGQSNGESKQADPYKTAVIDTIVTEVQSVPGEDRCVLLLGYKPQMLEMFQNVNAGLSRRFAIEDAFEFEDFSLEELGKILDLKLKQKDLVATQEARAVALKVLERAKMRPNFGNGGEVENALSRAKTNFLSRLKAGSSGVNDALLPQDFDPDFDRNEHAEADLEELFRDVIGCADVVDKLKGYQTIARARTQQGKDFRSVIPTNFVFKGPPGTGKTTTARKMGQVYYAMGFLSSADVVECSASDLVAQYVGQTGPKTRKMFEKALGRVLFIDEAYRLKEGHFAQEAIDEIVAILTEERFVSKIVVILAGYDEDINQLLSVNRGLASRFPEEILFINLDSDSCLRILANYLKKESILLPGIENETSQLYAELANLFSSLSMTQGWGNARDVLTIGREMVGAALKTSTAQSGDDHITLDPINALGCITSFLRTRAERASVLPTTHPHEFNLPVQTDRITVTPPKPKTSVSTSTKLYPGPTAPPKKADSDPQNDGRDSDVDDATWNQLQLDKKRQEDAEQATRAEITAAETSAKKALQRSMDLQRQEEQAARDAAKAKNKQKQDELKRRHEAMRLKLIAAQREKERLEAELAAKRAAEEQARKQEQEVQKKIREMGLCVAGYRWIKQSHGYRCAGGSHFLSNGQLGI